MRQSPCTSICTRGRNRSGTTRARREHHHRLVRALAADRRGAAARTRRPSATSGANGVEDGRRRPLSGRPAAPRTIVSRARGRPTAGRRSRPPPSPGDRGGARTCRGGPGRAARAPTLLPTKHAAGRVGDQRREQPRTGRRSGRTTSHARSPRRRRPRRCTRDRSPAARDAARRRARRRWARPRSRWRRRRSRPTTPASWVASTGVPDTSASITTCGRPS